MTATVSPLAPASFPALPTVAGVRLASAAAGLHYHDRLDLMLAALDAGTVMAGVFTRSLCPSAAVDWCRRILASGRGRAIVCNSGNANAFTGAAGAATARRTAGTVADQLGCAADEVFVTSTGIIAEQLDGDRLDAAVIALSEDLAIADGAGWQAAASAILTTDTFPKGAFAAVAGTDAHVVGIAKGSGMIAPDMATMLAFVFSDIGVSPRLLQAALQRSVDASFNRITVDSDTSTSDSVLLAATGRSSAAPIRDPADERYGALQDALDAVTVDLAQQVVRDGEGASKFVTVAVGGAADNEAAALIARSIADSPLVSTALAASDANWGRIVAAVGKAGQKADRDRLAIWIGDEQCAADGTARPGYQEERATRHLQGSEVTIRVDVGVGDGSAEIWTCDLTHGYIDINAGYRS